MVNGGVAAIALFNILVDIAAKTANFEEGLRRVEKQLETFQGTLGLLKNVTIAGFGIDAIFSYTKATLGAADAIGDAADRAGVLASEMSRMKYVAEQSDVSFESLETGVRQFQKTLSNAAAGSTEAAGALSAIGLSASDLRGKKLDEQLALVADQFGNITDPADRSRIAMELFGKSGTDLIPMLQKGGEGMAALAREADELGVTLNDLSTRAIDRSTKALNKFWAAAKGGTANMVGGLLADAFGSGDELLDAEYKLDKMLAKRDEYLNKAGDNVDAKRVAAMEAAIRKQQEYVESLRAVQRAEEQARASARAGLEEKKQTGKHQGKDTLEEVHVTARKKERSPYQDFLEQLDKQTQTSRERRDAEIAEGMEALQTLFDEGLITFEQFLDRESELRAKDRSTDLELFRRHIDQQDEIARRFSEDLGNLIGDGLVNGFDDGGKLALQIFAKLVQEMIREAQSAQLAKTMMGDGGGGGGGNIWGELLGAVIGAFAGREHGGPVSAGDAYIVGEKRPELFVPDRNGTIIPSLNGGGGNITVSPTYNIDARGATMDLAKALPGILKQHGDAIKADLLTGMRNKKYPIGV